MQHDEYENEIGKALDALGISRALIALKGWQLYRMPAELLIAEIDGSGNKHFLVPDAAKAWRVMKETAEKEEVILEIVSAFRSIDEQAAIIREKIDRAMPMERILTLSAPPGYSEHHSGCAVDINTPGCLPREEMFEATDAFHWLLANAGQFGFTLSYPRGNAAGFIYEPWHWFFKK
jgi:D-alanyl-D-alanine carboxypeptidase